MLLETCLADGVLVLFMLILLSYMAVHLFIGAESVSQNNTIDVVIRTSAAGIFGYFLSRNFGRRSEDETAKKTDGVYRNTISGGSTGQIGFRIRSEIGTAGDEQITDHFAAMQAGKISESMLRSERRDGIQIIVISAVGLGSLIILLFAKQFYSASGEYTAIVSQFRDFFSASVGFLISYRRGSQE